MGSAPKTRVALTIPYSPSSNTGNSVTALRIARELEERGLETRVWKSNRESDLDALINEIRDFGPSVIHGFHAYHFSLLAYRLRRNSKVPIVVTITGTDANVDLYKDPNRRLMSRCLRAASAIVTFCDATAERLILDLQLPRKKFHVIPQAVDLKPITPEARLLDQSREFIVSVIGGLRPVKNPLFCLAPIHSLRTERPNIVIRFAGPTLDKAILDELRSEMKLRPWVEYMGDVPRERIPDLIEKSHVIVNSSFSEGMSGVLLESMALGTPVLASQVEGNRAIIDDGVDGFLFDTESEFMEKLTRLIDAPDLRHNLAANAMKRIARAHRPEQEVEAHLVVYEDVVPQPIAAR